MRAVTGTLECTSSGRDSQLFSNVHIALTRLDAPFHLLNRVFFAQGPIAATERAGHGSARLLSTGSPLVEAFFVYIVPARRLTIDRVFKAVLKLHEADWTIVVIRDRFAILVDSVCIDWVDWRCL